MPDHRRHCEPAGADRGLVAVAGRAGRSAAGPGPGRRGSLATPRTQLPSTGNSSWVTALIALVALAGGTGLVRLSRRPTD